MSNIQANVTYSLTNAQGRTCADISGGDNVSIIGFSFHTGDNQLWTFENVGDHIWNIKSKSGKYLSVESGDPADQRLAVAAGSPYQWRVEDAQGGVRIAPASNNNYSLDLADHGNPALGTPIQLWSRSDNKNQIWEMQQVQV